MWPLVVVALVGAVGPPADPAATPAQAPTVTRVIVLVPAVADRRVDDVVASARSNLADDRVEIVRVLLADTAVSRIDAARSAASEHDARGVFWLDLRDDDEYFVYLWLPGRKTVLRRRVPEAAQSVEAAIEAMWIIVRSGSLAVATGVEVAMETVDAAAIDPRAPPPAKPAPKPDQPPPSDRPAASPRAPLGLWLSAAYLGLGYGSAIPWQSGGALELSYAVHRLVKVGLGYGIVGGAPVGDPHELEILRHEIAAVLGVGGSLHPRVRLEARLLPALELVRWRAPRQKNDGLQAAAKLAGELVLRVHVATRVTLDVGAGADIAFTDYDFVLCEASAGTCGGADRRVVVSPWRVRPRARAGVSVVF